MDYFSSMFENSTICAVDVEWDSDVETRRSTTGSIIVVNPSPVYWRRKL